MSRSGIILLFLFLLCVSRSALSLNTVAKKSSVFVENANILPRSVQFTNKSFCFFSSVGEDQVQAGARTALCSFDAGASVKEVRTEHPICTSGVIIEQQLFCPHDEVANDEDGEVEYSALLFSVHEGDVKEATAEKRFVFKSSRQTGEVKQVLFDGNAVRLDDDEDGFVLVSTIVNDAEERKVAVFKSDDGLLYKAISVIPDAASAEAHYLLYEGGRRLTLVSAHSSVQYSSVSSGYAGSFWSASKALNATAPPASASFASGVLIQYACSNESSATARWYISEDAGRRPVASRLPSIPSDKSINGMPLLLFAVAGSDDSKELVVVHNEVPGKGAGGARLSAFLVDDTAEVKERAEKAAKAREDLLKKEAARFKAKLKRLEGEKAQRREQRRKELERKRKFLADDEPNVLAAKAFMDVDGEMIIVRRVEKDSVSLEKEVFFADL